MARSPFTVGGNRALPWRDGLDLFDRRSGTGFLAALDYATALAGRGSISRDDIEFFGAALCTAAYFYHFGAALEDTEAMQGETVRQLRRRGYNAAADQLKRRRAGRPAVHRVHGLVWTLAHAFSQIGRHPGTADTPDSSERLPSRFTAICDEWLERIDPDSPLPSRFLYRAVLKKMRKTGLLDAGN